jgi:hypothetical protein
MAGDSFAKVNPQEWKQHKEEEVISRNDCSEHFHPIIF